MQKPRFSKVWAFLRSCVLVVAVALLIVHYLPSVPTIDGVPLNANEIEMIRGRRLYAGHGVRESWEVQDKIRLMQKFPPRGDESAAEYEARIGLLDRRKPPP